MSAILTRDEIRAMNEALFEKLSSRNPEMEKEAADAVNEFTRYKMREDGFYRRILPPIPINNEDLTRQVGTDKPVVVVDMEPDSPAAMSIPFATLPSNLYIRGRRYLVMLDRIVTPRFTKDVDELRTYVMDIRQVLSDNAIKDMLAEEDGKFIRAVNTCMVGAGVTVPTSGVIQYEEISGGITRDTLWDAMKIMPSTPSRLEAETLLINNLTIKEVCKMGRDEMGGDPSADVFKQGWTEQNFMGKKWIITIKQDLVPTNAMFMFADPAFTGKNFQLEDTTMYIKREAYMLEFFAYETCGGTIANTNSVARADFV